MARKQTLDAIIQLYKKLGGNTSEVLGTKTNVNFLGKGKSPELMLDMDINVEALGVLPRSKAVEELKNSVGYAVSGKLNDIQASQLLRNMQTMDSVYFPPAAPANITDMATRTRNLDKEGLMSLRDDIDLPEGVALEDTILPRGVGVQRVPAADVVDDLPPPGSRGGPEDIAAPFSGAGLEAIKNVKGSNLIVDDIVDKIYLNAGVADAAKPAVRGNAREFLLKVKDLSDEPGNTSLADVMEVDDFKFMTEGGGGGMGDPFLLVQKYFGPKVASAVANLDSADDIQLFAERLVSVKDARGNSVTSRFFDPESVDIKDFEFAKGGRVGFNMGGGQFTSGGNISPGTDVRGNVRSNNPFTGGGDNRSVTTGSTGEGGGDSPIVAPKTSYLDKGINYFKSIFGNDEEKEGGTVSQATVDAMLNPKAASNYEKLVTGSAEALPAGFDPNNPDTWKFKKGGRVGFNMGGGQFTSGGNISPGTDARGNVRDDNPFSGGGGGGDNNPPVRTFIKKDSIGDVIPVGAGLEAMLANNQKLKAYLDLKKSLKDEELVGQVDFTGNIGGLNIGASADLAGDKNLNLGYRTKGGTNLGFTTDLDNNAMFTLNKTFADGGRVPMFMGGAARMGYQALRKYGIEGKDISRLFASLGSDKSLVGKEKTAYFQQLHKVLRNPDAFPDEIMDIQKQLGIDVGIGFRNGGLAGILEV